MRLLMSYANLISLRLYITPWRSIDETHPNTYSLTILRIWSTLAGNMLSALYAKRNYSTRTDSRLTINNINQYQWMKDYYLMGCYHLQDGIDPSHHGLTSVGASAWLSMSSSTNNLRIDNGPGASPPQDTSDEETIYLQKPDLTGTPDPTKRRAHRQVVGVEYVGGKAYGKATGLYNKHRKYSEQWNPWHPSQPAHQFQQG